MLQNSLGHLAVVEQAEIRRNRSGSHGLWRATGGDRPALATPGAALTEAGCRECAQASNRNGFPAAFTLAVGAVQDLLQGCVNFLYRMQRLVVETGQEARGLFFLGMLLQFALALLSNDV